MAEDEAFLGMFEGGGLLETGHGLFIESTGWSYALVDALFREGF